MTHCKNIRLFSIAVYDFLTEIFGYGLSFSELGLTDHLVLEIARHSNLYNYKNIEIYKTSWVIESVYGNDLDLFIQDNSGMYNWYALQAKVLSSNGAYKDLKEKPKQTKQQWDKLIDHEANFGSISYYLLYNGKFNHQHFTLSRTDCLGIPSVKELGLGIVETKTIKTIRSTLGAYSNLYFNHVCPNHMDSIRKLFCCNSNLPKSKVQFNRKDISTNGYKLIYKNDNLSNDDEITENKNNNIEKGFAPIRMIIDKSQ